MQTAHYKTGVVGVGSRTTWREDVEMGGSEANEEFGDLQREHNRVINLSTI